VVVVVLAAIGYAVAKMFSILAMISSLELGHIVWGAGATLLRVEAVLLLAALWAVPVGVVVGLRPRLSAIVQPIAQIAASIPATALFPIILLVLIRAGGGLGVGSIVLLLLGTQWYILFNVIAGATAIPADLKEVCTAYHLSLIERWRRLFLPAIFPYLITGFVTASGVPGMRASWLNTFTFAAKPFRLPVWARSLATQPTAAIFVCSWPRPQ
jgi:NitT/TauT family transport system permease protein